MKKPAKKKLIVLLSTTAVILAISAIGVITGNKFISNVVGTVTSPVQKGVAVTVNATKSFFGNIADSGKNAKENRKLKNEILDLESQVRMLEGYRAENDKLRSMIELEDSRTEFKSVGANVIGRDSSEFNDTITIDKGSKDGIKVNAAVTVPEGLVGTVYEVGYNYSKVRTIYDSDSAVSAICLRTGDMGIMESTGNMSSYGICNMNYIDKSAKTVVGDIIETSGTGGIYPKGILIGKVTKIEEDSRNLTLSATIETNVNLNNIDIVMVAKRD